MFREVLAFVYIISVFYAHFRLRSLLPNPLTKIVFTSFYLLLMLSLPAAEIIFRAKGWGWFRPENSFSYYVLAYILYLPLTVLAIDVLLGLNFLLRIVPRTPLNNPGYRIAGLIIILVVPLAVTVAGSVNYNLIRVSAYHIELARRSSSLEHLRIAVASDFHLRKLTRKSFMPAFLAKIRTLKPDIVLIPGDILERSWSNGRAAEFAAAFRQIRTKYGVYASMGNHESLGTSHSPSFFEEAGIRMLIDSAVRIDDAIYLVGRKDNQRRQRKPLSILLQDTKSDLPVLLMDHRPSGLQEVARSPVDIQFSGHTHNGQLFPGDIVRRLQYGLSWGHKKIGQTDFFVTCGIQGVGPPVRTAGYSEIMLVDVDFVK